MVTDYTITNESKNNISKALQSTDIIYMSGGNTYYLLFQLQQTGASQLIKAAVRQGKIYIGTSAGSQVAGPDIDPLYKPEDKKWAKKVKITKAMGLVDLVIFPHWGSKDLKDLYLNYRLKRNYTTDHKFIILNDYQYLEVLKEGYTIVEVRNKT